MKINKTFFIKHQTLLLISCTLLACCLAGMQAVIISTQKTNENTARLQALKETQAKAGEKRTPRAGGDVITEEESPLFKDARSETTTVACERLRNRSSIVITSPSCDYTLRAHGVSTMAVVVFYETTRPKSLPRGFERINAYLQNQGRRYGVKDVRIDLSYFGAYKLNKPVSGYYYREEGDKIMEVLAENAKRNNIPEENYDMTHYIVADIPYGGAAIPWIHRAFTYSYDAGVFAHETLHLYGASDKYNNDDCYKIGVSDPFRRNPGLKGIDIMCESQDLSYSIINDITAREIGWEN